MAAAAFTLVRLQGLRHRRASRLAWTSIRSRIRPKLEAIGHSLVPDVSRATGDALPSPTWPSTPDARSTRRMTPGWRFGPEARGYKKPATSRWRCRDTACASSSRWARSTPTRSAGPAPGRRARCALGPVLRRVRGLAWFKNEHDEEPGRTAGRSGRPRTSPGSPTSSCARATASSVLGRKVAADEAARWTEAQYRSAALETFRRAGAALPTARVTTDRRRARRSSTWTAC